MSPRWTPAIPAAAAEPFSLWRPATTHMLYTQLHNYSPRAQQLLAAAQRHVDDE